MRNRLAPLALVGLVAVAGVGAAAMVEEEVSAGEPAKDKPGLKVGTKAPTFSLKDQAGKERALEEFVKKGNVALVFYRSASW
jgi:hypothetical protein